MQHPHPGMHAAPPPGWAGPPPGQRGEYTGGYPGGPQPALGFLQPPGLSNPPPHVAPLPYGDVPPPRGAGSYAFYHPHPGVAAAPGAASAPGISGMPGSQGASRELYGGMSFAAQDEARLAAGLETFHISESADGLRPRRNTQPAVRPAFSAEQQYGVAPHAQPAWQQQQQLLQQQQQQQQNFHQRQQNSVSFEGGTVPGQQQLTGYPPQHLPLPQSATGDGRNFISPNAQSPAHAGNATGQGIVQAAAAPPQAAHAGSTPWSGFDGHALSQPGRSASVPAAPGPQKVSPKLEQGEEETAELTSDDLDEVAYYLCLLQPEEFGVDPMLLRAFEVKRQHDRQHQSKIQPPRPAIIPPPPAPDDKGEYRHHSLYKTELCKSFSETGSCKYGPKCQFSHGIRELRPALRHPKYKTSVCKTYMRNGTCPYGSRCRFIHEFDERDSAVRERSVSVSYYRNLMLKHHEAVMLRTGTLQNRSAAPHPVQRSPQPTPPVQMNPRPRQMSADQPPPAGDGSHSYSGIDRTTAASESSAQSAVVLGTFAPGSLAASVLAAQPSWWTTTASESEQASSVDAWASGGFSESPPTVQVGSAPASSRPRPVASPLLDVGGVWSDDAPLDTHPPSSFS